MRFACRPTGLDFVDVAPHRVVTEEVLPAPPERVFAVLVDETSWPQWFPGMTRVEWLGPERGVGAMRRVALGPLVIEERFLAWEPGRRFTFAFDGANAPGLRAVVEDYRLEPAGGDATRLRWMMCYAPAPGLGLVAPVAHLVLGGMLQRAGRGLARYLTR
jgi:uncharacterized protein YndB with AHSA1/START domain